MQSRFIHSSVTGDDFVEVEIDIDILIEFEDEMLLDDFVY